LLKMGDFHRLTPGFGLPAGTARPKAKIIAPMPIRQAPRTPGTGLICG
jgi:hypothetical protein